jgi:hypothetical protein
VREQLKTLLKAGKDLLSTVYSDMREEGAPPEEACERYESEAVRAQTLARSGSLLEAQSIIDGLPDDTQYSGWLHEKTIALVELASEHWRRGSGAAALEALARATVTGLGLIPGSTWEASECYLLIGRSLAANRQSAQATIPLELAVALAQARQAVGIDCANILARVSRVYSEMGDPQAATRIAESIVVAALRQRTLAELSTDRSG